MRPIQPSTSWLSACPILQAEEVVEDAEEIDEEIEEEDISEDTSRGAGKTEVSSPGRPCRPPALPGAVRSLIRQL